MNMLSMIALDRKELEQEKDPNAISACPLIPGTHLFTANAL